MESTKAILPIIAAAVAVGALTPAAAHPHAWIDIRVAVVFDAAGQVTALRQAWRFDDLYSSFATEGFDQDGDGVPDPANLDALVDTLLYNLEGYDYYTVVEADGDAVSVETAREVSSGMVGPRLEMRFTLPLAAPVPVDQAPLHYAVYDPTFYVEVLHDDGHAPVTLASAPAGCRTHIQDPAPSLETVSLAQALDIDETLDTEIGQYFAEWVTVRCRESRSRAD